MSNTQIAGSGIDTANYPDAVMIAFAAYVGGMASAGSKEAIAVWEDFLGSKSYKDAGRKVPESSMLQSLKSKWEARIEQLENRVLRTTCDEDKATGIQE